MLVVPLLCVAIMASTLGSPPALSPLDSDAKSYLLLLGLAWFLGWAICSLAGPFILGPIYLHRAKLNGAPFAVGDMVEILVGPNRGRVLRVLEPLDGRGLVKVDLGEHASRKGKSIFGTGNFFEEAQLIKVIDAEQHLAASTPQAARHRLKR
jgi:hypothetical protein